ncbi:MAG: hypothetical protein R2865_16360 [Deinococcales bacterium]
MRDSKGYVSEWQTNTKYYRLILGAVLLLFLIVACAQQELASPSPSTKALFSDEDADRAISELEESLEILAEDELQTSPVASLDSVKEIQAQDRQAEAGLATQAVNAWEDAPGYIYFVRRFLNRPKSQIIRYQPSSAQELVLYETRYEIQSVAGSADGQQVVFSFRYQGNSKEELFLLSLSPSPKLRRLTRTADIAEVDVSMSNDGHIIAWQGLYQGRESVFYRQFSEGFSGSSQKVLVHSSPQLEPQLSGDGTGLVLRRNYQSIYWYNLSRQRYRFVYSMQGGNIRSPSVSNDGLKVAWLETVASGRSIYLKDMSNQQLSKLLGSDDIYLDLIDPHLSSDGNWLSYGKYNPQTNLRQAWMYHLPSRLKQAATDQNKDHWSFMWALSAPCKAPLSSSPKCPSPKVSQVLCQPLAITCPVWKPWVEAAISGFAMPMAALRI